MNFTEKITLEQAIMLKEKIAKGEMPDIEIYYQYYQTDDHHGNLGSYYLDRCYKDNNDAILLTRSDYAQYIQGNKPLPDGYDYPKKDLKSGIYEGLEYLTIRSYDNREFGRGNYKCFLSENYGYEVKWYNYAFLKLDLARVEAEVEPEKTEINAAQVAFISYAAPITINGKKIYNPDDFSEGNTLNLIVNNKTKHFEISSKIYNDLPDEFKALAEPKPSMPTNFVDSPKIANSNTIAFLDKELIEARKQIAELEAKYEAQASEIARYLEMGTENARLKLQLQEATELAETRQARIEQLKKELEASRNRNAALNAKFNMQWQLLEKQNDLNNEYHKVLRNNG